LQKKQLAENGGLALRHCKDASRTRSNFGNFLELSGTFGPAAAAAAGGNGI